MAAKKKAPTKRKAPAKKKAAKRKTSVEYIIVYAQRGADIYFADVSRVKQRNRFYYAPVFDDELSKAKVIKDKASADVIRDLVASKLAGESGVATSKIDEKLKVKKK